MTKQKTEFIPFVEGNQPFCCRVMPSKSNGYQTTFEVNGTAFLSSVFNACHRRWCGSEKTIFKENYSFDDELIISSVYSSTSGVTIDLMSKVTRKTYCATGDEAYKIIMMSNRGVVKGRFTFKHINRDKYSLVMIDPTTEYYITDDTCKNRTIARNYSEDVIKAIYDSFSKEMKETSHIDVCWK